MLPLVVGDQVGTLPGCAVCLGHAVVGAVPILRPLLCPNALRAAPVGLPVARMLIFEATNSTRKFPEAFVGLVFTLRGRTLPQDLLAEFGIIDQGLVAEVLELDRTRPCPLLGAAADLDALGGLVLPCPDSCPKFQILLSTQNENPLI